jgi:hypothetical protein
MNVDTSFWIVFGITVASNMISLFDYCHAKPCPAGLLSYHTAKQSTSDYDKVEVIEHDVLYY